MQSILDGKASVDWSKETGQGRGNTVLCAASKNGHLETVMLLATRGASINLVGEHGDAPLYAASSNGHENIVKALIKAKAVVNQAQKDGDTALFAASAGGHLRVVDLLAENGADATITNKRGRSALHSAAEAGYSAIAKVLLARCGAHLDQTDSDEATPVFIASQKGRSATVKVLLELKASVNLADKSGNTPLCAATRGGSEAVATILLNHGAKVSATNISGDTALILAARFDKLAIGKLLLAHGANADFRENVDRKSAGDWARERNGVFAEYLDEMEGLKNLAAPRDEKFEEEKLIQYAAKGDSKGLDSLLQTRAQIDWQNEEGQTPLLAAVQEGHADTIDLLIRRKADIDKSDFGGDTPLAIATSLNNVEAVRLLLERGADVTRRTQWDETIVELAESKIAEYEEGVQDAATESVEQNLQVQVSTARSIYQLLISAEESARDVRDQLEALQGARGIKVPWMRYRVMLVGKDRVGKTSLIGALQGKPFDPNKESTHVSPAKLFLLFGSLSLTYFFHFPSGR